MYLIDKGIAATRLTAQGYGPTRPIAANQTNKGRAQNRRVDFIVVDPPSPRPPAATAAPPPPPPP